MGVYILHFIEPFKHAAHYTGFSPEIQARVNAHLHGKGARLTEVVHSAGIQMVLVKVWEEADRTFERRLKNHGHIRRYCPICCGLGVQLPLLAGEPAYVPEEEADEESTASVDIVDDSQMDWLDEQDAEEWQDYFLDMDWLRTGL